jgi:hypothetical protein
MRLANRPIGFVRASALRGWCMLAAGGRPAQMTQMEVSYRYANRPTEAAVRAIDSVREVYGIRRLRFDEKEQIVRVEYDASRFKEPVVANLLRGAGLDIGEKLIPA